MYVCEWDMCWRNFYNFPWWLKMWKVGQNSPFLKWAPKKKTITFSWSKLCKLHKKDPILHATNTFSLKQGETRTKCVYIPHPLSSYRGWSFQAHFAFRYLPNIVFVSYRSNFWCKLYVWFYMFDIAIKAWPWTWTKRLMLQYSQITVPCQSLLPLSLVLGI